MLTRWALTCDCGCDFGCGAIQMLSRFLSNVYDSRMTSFLALVGQEVPVILIMYLRTVAHWPHTEGLLAKTGEELVLHCMVVSEKASPI